MPKLDLNELQLPLAKRCSNQSMTARTLEFNSEALAATVKKCKDNVRTWKEEIETLGTEKMTVQHKIKTLETEKRGTLKQKLTPSMKRINHVSFATEQQGAYCNQYAAYCRQDEAYCDTKLLHTTKLDA
jgi:septal ring factor EnvC (AmiA/AmiB activator)